MLLLASWVPRGVHHLCKWTKLVIGGQSGPKEFYELGLSVQVLLCNSLHIFNKGILVISERKEQMTIHDCLKSDGCTIGSSRGEMLMVL
jgi:hypothetical protein